MIDFYPPHQIHGGNRREVEKLFETMTVNYPDTKVHLDLSQVDYMDTAGFRLVFNYLSKFPKVTPPKSEKVIEMYDLWVDSKKGLKK